MADAVIDNPILNGPYDAPTRHWRFDEAGITDEAVVGRRTSGYFTPVPEPRQRGRQLALQTSDRYRANEIVNAVRGRLELWRRRGRPGVTSVTRSLLDHWTDPARERPLFFAQVEAAETAVYLLEVAKGEGDAWLDNELRAAAAEANPGLLRVAMKMATGSGKTTVMGMIVTWQACNKAANRRDARFSDAFLVVAPGITVKDRLRVLLPSDPGNVYRERDLVPPEHWAALQGATVVVTNFHAFGQRETGLGRSASSTTKRILAPEGSSPFTETPDQMVRRVTRELRGKKGLVVLNDEAHHCYRRRIEQAGDETRPGERLTSADKAEAEQRDTDARLWLNGLLAVARKVGVRVAFDLSATPFFLRGSGYAEGTLFPWVVSDFSLIDAIESGLVKIPRVPVSDDRGVGDAPTYRDFWHDIRDLLPKRGRGTSVDGQGDPQALPLELDGALRSLYDDYARSFRDWEASDAARSGSTPPVFIVVCSNTAVSKWVFDTIAGWEAMLADGASVLREGDYPLFTNVDERGGWRGQARTILVDSRQLESGDGLSKDFKRLAARQIEEFLVELRERFPGRDTDAITDDALMREVLNTVGKAGRLGEHVRCVVSVSMLTEGWDANTVSHILGVRAFGTQLLCEQVVGRGLRRRSYAVGDDGLLEPEYAEVYGVPFSFIPGGGKGPGPKPPKPSTLVRALPERAGLAIRFPHVVGYRRELADERLYLDLRDFPPYVLTRRDLPTQTVVSGLVGETDTHTLETLQRMRAQQVVFTLARHVLDTHLRSADGQARPWMFPQLVPLVAEVVRGRVDLHDDTFVGLLLLGRHATALGDRIGDALTTNPGVRQQSLQPLLRPYDPEGSTAGVGFDTTKRVQATQKSHISHVVADSRWEFVVGDVLEALTQVAAYAKNDRLGFGIPYSLDGVQRTYLPDFLVSATVPEGMEPLTVIVEVSGQAKRDKAEKIRTATELWVPAVEAQGAFGRWAFVEVTTPGTAKTCCAPPCSLDRSERGASGLRGWISPWRVCAEAEFFARGFAHGPASNRSSGHTTLGSVT